MNAIGSIEAVPPTASFDSARDAVMMWRGQCLDLFTRSEAAVTRTLLDLAAVGGSGRPIKVPHFGGQRYDLLAEHIGAEGRFAILGKHAAGRLDAFRKHLALRSFFTHGVFTVTLDRRGCWHLIARFVALRSQEETEELFVTDEHQAAKILATIKQDGQLLGSALGHLRKQLQKP